MPKYNFGLSSDAADANLDAFYSGPVPPSGVYRCRVKQTRVSKNKNDDGMLKVLLEIEELKKSDKAQFNGYAMWPQMNITDQGARWLNNFLLACGADPKEFNKGNILISSTDFSKEKPADLQKVGTRKLVDQIVMANCKYESAEESYNGEPRLVATGYLVGDGKAAPATEDEGDESDAEDEAEGLSDPEVEEEAAEADGEESDDYTEEELTELSPADLKGICDEWEISYAPKATAKTLIKAILKFQEEANEASEEEPETDEGDAEGEADESEDLTAEELEEMDKTELIEYIKEKEWPMPKKQIPSLLRSFILKTQAEPPF